MTDKKWTPEQFWEYVEGLTDAHTRDGIREMLTERGLCVLPQSPDQWQPIETAPGDGRLALVYRPLALKSGDEPATVKRLIGGNNFCWDATVPKGSKPTNPTDGSCHVTHWAPIPEPPQGPDTRPLRTSEEK